MGDFWSHFGLVNKQEAKREIAKLSVEQLVARERARVKVSAICNNCGVFYPSVSFSDCDICRNLTLRERAVESMTSKWAEDLEARRRSALLHHEQSGEPIYYCYVPGFPL